MNIVETIQNIAPNIIFFLPLGIIGIWRWSVWVFKKIYILFYKEKTGQFIGNVSIITPVYNEDPKLFINALNSWAENNPYEIIAVIDYTDEKCIKAFTEFSKGRKNCRKIITKKPGKRAALADGIKEATGEIVALVDSDTLWTPGVMSKSLIPFTDPKIGGVATRQNVYDPKTLAQKIFDILLDLRYLDDMRFLAAAGPYTRCLSGRTAFYRRSAVLPLADQLENETFMGQKAISGDDKCLTYLVQANGWHTYYQHSALVYTPGTEKMETFLKQKIRWTRNSWRADTKAFFNFWIWKSPLFAIGFLDSATQPFTLILSPCFLIMALYLGLWNEALLLVSWWLISRGVKIFGHLRRRPQDITILPIYIGFTFLSAIIKIYSLVTINTQGWITRWDKSRLNTIGIVKTLYSYIFTALIIFGLFFLVASKRLQTYSTAQEHIKTPKNTGQLLISTNPNSDKKEFDYQYKEVLTRHVVAAGENLSTIAHNYNIGEDRILLFNESVIPSRYYIAEGTVLNIPSNELTKIDRKNYSSTYINIPSLSIYFDKTQNSIEVSGRGNVITIKELYNRLGDEYIQKLSEKEYLLKKDLNINPGVTINLKSEDIETLKLLSTNKEFVKIIVYDSRMVIDNVKITSWDTEKNIPDEDYSDGRSYILAKSDSRLDIFNSDISYLGYKTTPIKEGGTYGVSWRIPDNTYTYDIVTGTIENSSFHNNYFGAYTFGGTGIIFRNNKFYQNVAYGLDPHDDSNYFIVEGNSAYENGTHGIIFSKRCLYNTIRNNVTYKNKGHGIMLHEKSNYNVVENNKTYENTDGIAIYASKDNLITNNEVYKNKHGVRISHGSLNNQVTANKVTNNSSYGIYIYEKSDGNYVKDNSFSFNNFGVYIKTNENVLEKNMLSFNNIGVVLLGEANNNVLKENKITNNYKYGVHNKTNSDKTNILEGNTIKSNRKNIG